MKKIGLSFLTVLVVIGLILVGSAHAQWHGHYRGWGPGIYWGGPVVVGPSWYPYAYYPQPPTNVQQAPISVEPQQQNDDAYYWYYCENPKGYYPYITSCPAGWMKVVPNSNPQSAPSD